MKFSRSTLNHPTLLYQVEKQSIHNPKLHLRTFHTHAPASYFFHQAYDRVSGDVPAARRCPPAGFHRRYFRRTPLRTSHLGPLHPHRRAQSAWHPLTPVPSQTSCAWTQLHYTHRHPVVVATVCGCGRARKRWCAGRHERTERLACRQAAWDRVSPVAREVRRRVG